ncbi:hypothetical protein L2E82_24529 [Cichorium intybus]|uniref:Uncharacterized protein n=2 Tax=Cichorium intybus TaxID=13427 RepID=A0ACB9E1A3_CICIN|nr:hypothetical protein L2E82_24528 [Cichorium intybus]KAI3752496.1 hypothetical protein L2E82_24529 [Cichorium intybus]
MAWIGELSKNLKEFRVLFCQTSPASIIKVKSAFVEKNYKESKKANPNFAYTDSERLLDIICLILQFDDQYMSG